MGSRRGWQIAFALALLAQSWALYVPRAPGLQTGLPLDKVVHLALFAAVTWLGLRCGLTPTWLVALMLMQAALSELVQHWWLPQRGGDWWDFVADVAGIVLGLVLGRARRGSVERSGIPV